LKASPIRPIAITILCIVMVLGVSAALMKTLVLCLAHGSPSLYIRALGMATILMCAMGFWQMRRWALPLYLMAVAANTAAVLANGGRFWWPLVAVPLAVAMIVLYHFRSMR